MYHYSQNTSSVSLRLTASPQGEDKFHQVRDAFFSYPPADDSFEAQYEAGKKFANEFFERGKFACFSSFYSSFPMSEGFAKGMYEVSRQKAAQ